MLGLALSGLSELAIAIFVCKVLPSLDSILIFVDKCHKLLNAYADLSIMTLFWVVLFYFIF